MDLDVYENKRYAQPDEPMFHVRITDKNGMHFIATLPPAFATNETRMEPYEKGIKVTAPNQAPIYINGGTRQISRDPEVCRTDTIIDPRFVTIGRERNEGLIEAATKVYGESPIRSH